MCVGRGGRRERKGDTEPEREMIGAESEIILFILGLDMYFFFLSHKSRMNRMEQAGEGNQHVGLTR